MELSIAYSSKNFHGVGDLVAGRCGHHGFDVAGAAVYHRFDRENLNGHLRQFFFHQPEIANLLAESFALLGVFRGGHQHVFRAAYAAGAQRKAAGVQDVESNDVAAPDFVQQVLLGHPTIFQEYRRGGAAMNPHFVFFIPGFAARVFTFYDEGGKFLAINFGEYDI